MQFFFLQAFLLIFFSELGDKTFFIAVRVEHNMFNKLFQMLVSELGVLMHASLHELGAKFVFNEYGLSSLFLSKIIRQYASQSHRRKKRAPFQLFFTLVVCSVKKNNQKGIWPSIGKQILEKHWEKEEAIYEFYCSEVYHYACWLMYHYDSQVFMYDRVAIAHVLNLDSIRSILVCL